MEQIREGVYPFRVLLHY